jgi:hypothetical protein
MTGRDGESMAWPGRADPMAAIWSTIAAARRPQRESWFDSEVMREQPQAGGSYECTRNDQFRD